MWTRSGTVLSVSSRALVDACERLGVDTGAMLDAVGVSRETLDDPDARLEAATASALWTEAYRLSGDPVLSLHAAEACPDGAYKVIDYMAANARTVGEAFLYSTRYFKLINTAISLPIDASGDPITFDIIADRAADDVSRPYAEYCFAAYFLRVKSATAVSFPLQGLQFVQAPPPSTAEHERLFGCPVEFGCKHTRMLIGREAWELPTQVGQPGVLAVLAEHADLLLEKLPTGPDLVERTRKAISERLRRGDPSLESVARELAMSERSLQRHLKELGYSFNALVDELRQGTAKLYLAQPDIAIAEVAYLLGFSDQSTFNRAFKRWLGITPKQYRVQAT
ncbi:MAG: AraC family transcriptional regulator [Myxococcales bacterium]|nr:AraC family transcriptional regulator [Myxococcales bacterium]